MTAARQQLDVIKVEAHHRGLIGIWHVTLRRTPGSHRSIDLYLTTTELADYGIDLPGAQP